MKNEITELLSESCKTASEMTHGLKKIGDGDMKRGMMTIAQYYEENGLKKGSLMGVISTLTVVGLIAGTKKVYSMNKEHKIKGEKIVKGLEQSIDDSNDTYNTNEECGKE